MIRESVQMEHRLGVVDLELLSDFLFKVLDLVLQIGFGMQLPLELGFARFDIFREMGPCSLLRTKGLSALLQVLLVPGVV